MPVSHILLALLVAVVWGFNFVVIQIGLKEIPPLCLSFTRFLFFLPALLFVKRPKVPFNRIIWYGLIMFALQFSLLFLGMYAGVSAGLTSLIDQVQVFFSILIAVLLFNEKVHIWQVIGGLIAFGGIALVAMHLGGGVTLLGFLLVIASAAAWSTGSLISKKLGKVDVVSLIVWGSLVAWPPLLLLSLLVEGPHQIAHSLLHLSWQSGGAILYITLLSTLFGYGSWSWLIHHHPISTIAPFALLVPVAAMIGSVLVLGEPLQTWKIWAGILVIGGLCMNMLGPRLFSRRNRN